LSDLNVAQSRLWPAIAAGVTAFILLFLLLIPGNFAPGVGIFAIAILGAVLLGIWLVRRSTSPKSAWGAGCFVNGLLSTAVAVGARVQDDFWEGRSQYAGNLDRAIGPLTHFVWVWAARISLIALILAMGLFAISYWLMSPSHRKA
jgi:hypothetical protein